MDDVQLANYVAGIDPGPVAAGRIGRDLARFLSVAPGTAILLSNDTWTKTRFHHPEVKFQDYLEIPAILAQGFAATGNKNRTVEICHIDSQLPKFRLWRMCIRATSKNEVFVTSFHRLDLKEARRLYRRATRMGRILRDHNDQLARRLFSATPVRPEGGAP